MSDMKLRRLRAVPSEPATEVNDLLGRAGLGNEEAFGQLYDQVSGLVFGVVLKVLRDRDQAAEVTQEVFVEVWRLASRFEPDRGSGRSWICTIAHRRAVDRVRSEQSRRTREQAEATKAPTTMPDNASVGLERNADIELVQNALDTLTEAQRESVTLAYFGGHTYREVAALLDIPEGTVKTRIRDGLIRLRDTIGLDQ